jgi:Amidohydrolase
LKQLGETLDKYPNLTVDCAARLRILGRLNPPAIRDFFTKYQDRILFGTDNQVFYKTHNSSGSANISVYPSDDPNWLTIDPNDKEAVERWKAKAARFYGDFLAYFETDRVDIEDPNHSGGAWLRLAGAKLPPDVLEKLYHKNAERLIPGLGKK